MTDPPDEFLARFASHSPAVKKVSRCRVESDGGGVVDPETGGTGLIFRVVDILWLPNEEADVTGDTTKRD